MIVDMFFKVELFMLCDNDMVFKTITTNMGHSVNALQAGDLQPSSTLLNNSKAPPHSAAPWQKILR
jgi:hypothetical protein